MVSKPECPFCENAKDFLNKRNIKFKEFDYKQYTTLSDEITKIYKHKTYPKIFIDQEFVGGFSDLVKKFENKSVMNSKQNFAEKNIKDL